MSLNRGRVVATMVVVASLGVAGCGNDTPTQAQAESQACEAVASVRDALEGVAGLDADSTVDEATDAKQTLDDALAGLQDAASDLQAADQAALQAGGQAISSAIDGVSGSDTIGAAGQVVSQAGDTLRDAISEIANGLGCS